MMLLGLLKLGRHWSFTFQSGSHVCLQGREKCKANMPSCWRMLNGRLEARSYSLLQCRILSLLLYTAQNEEGNSKAAGLDP